MRVFIATICCFLCASGCNAKSAYFEKTPQGWHWNNVKKNKILKKKKKAPKTMKNTAQDNNSPIKQMSAIHYALALAKDRAVLNPTVSNIRDYLMVQQIITAQSTRFMQNWQKTLLLFPEFDYNIAHPVQSAENQAYQSHLHDLKVRSAHLLSQQDGILYFYRNKNILDEVMRKTIRQFSSWYHFSLIAVPVNRSINQSETQKLGIKALPATVLVNPKTGEHKILMYGYGSNEAILSACFNLITNYKGLNQ